MENARRRINRSSDLGIRAEIAKDRKERQSNENHILNITKLAAESHARERFGSDSQDEQSVVEPANLARDSGVEEEDVCDMDKR